MPAARRKAPPGPDSPDRKAIRPEKREETLKGLPLLIRPEGGNILEGPPRDKLAISQ